jgi:hypothetical protein
VFTQHPTPKELCVYTTPLVWVESTGVCFQSLARRSRYSVRPLKFECDCFDPHSKRVFGHRNRSSFGPNSSLYADAAGSNLAVCLRAGPGLLGTVA